MDTVRIKSISTRSFFHPANRSHGQHFCPVKASRFSPVLCPWRLPFPLQCVVNRITFRAYCVAFGKCGYYYLELPFPLCNLKFLNIRLDDCMSVTIGAPLRKCTCNRINSMKSPALGTDARQRRLSQFGRTRAVVCPYISVFLLPERLMCQ
jgi:hypothetical protein